MNHKVGVPFIGQKFICNYCGSIVQSKYSGYFSMCKCGKSYVDETTYYIRSGGDLSSLERLLFEDFLAIWETEKKYKK